MEPILNKVAQSGIVTLDLEEMYDERPRVIFDIKDHLFMGLMLKEKEFRDFIKTNDWEQYRDQYVAVLCSSDAIVPTWAYMLVANKLSPVAAGFVFGDLQALEDRIFALQIDRINAEEYRDQRVVVKGCSKKPVPVSAYVQITGKLSPVVKSLMFGEPCSTVPVYKRP